MILWVYTYVKNNQIIHFNMHSLGSSLVAQWSGLHASTAGGTGSIPGQGTKTPQAVQHSQ